MYAYARALSKNNFYKILGLWIVFFKGLNQKQNVAVLKKIAWLESRVCVARIPCLAWLESRVRGSNPV